MPRTITLDGRSLTFEDLWAIAQDRASVRLKMSPAARRRMGASRGHVEKAIRDGRTVYGVNTGFGRMSDVRIEGDHLDDLQTNLLRSHAVGMGPYLRNPGLFIALRANSLLRGHSGVRPQLVEMLLAMFNRGVEPMIPEIGSVGASGDLAPLAELGVIMMGEGQAQAKGRVLPASKALAAARLRPFQFQAKEALALINGTQLICTILTQALAAADTVMILADIAGAMSLEALKGSLKPFDARVHDARPHRGQGVVAANFRRLLAKSEVLDSHRNCTKVQDAYSLRCIPQVHGAARDAFDFAAQVLLTEVNSSTDNPLVFENGDIISAGNFHGQPVAHAADFLAIAMATVSNIVERRIDRMTNPDLSELPPFLIEDSGLQSGFMMVQVAAAALAAEQRSEAAPASVHSIPTGASKEDHVSMGVTAARKAERAVHRLHRLVDLELHCAAQALDFLKPLRPGRGVAAAHAVIRKRVPFLQRDTYMRKHLAPLDPLAIIKAARQASGDLR